MILTFVFFKNLSVLLVQSVGVFPVYSVSKILESTWYTMKKGVGSNHKNLEVPRVGDTPPGLYR